jgi:uncharacterized membrane protein HdeD (DUF308 family)
MKDESIWGVELLGGIATLIFGVAAVFWPGLTLLTLLYLFASYVLAVGVTSLMAGVFHIGDNTTASMLRILLGMLQLGVAVYLLRHPHLTFTTFILLIGFTLIFRGVFHIVGAFIEDVRPNIQALSVFTGLLSLVVGVIVLFQPSSSGVAFVWLLGVYALISGPLIISASIEDRKLAA